MLDSFTKKLHSSVDRKCLMQALRDIETLLHKTRTPFLSVENKKNRLEWGTVVQWPTHSYV